MAPQGTISRGVDLNHADSPFTTGGIAALGLPVFLLALFLISQRFEESRDWEGEFSEGSATAGSAAPRDPWTSGSTILPMNRMLPVGLSRIMNRKG